MTDQRDAPAIEILRQLVAIPSLSGDERQAVEFLVGAMNDLGFDESYRDEAGNAVGIRRGSDSPKTNQKTLIFLGHIDTVHGSIPVREEDGKLYGRGSVDAKGPLAAFVSAVAAARIPAGIEIAVIGAVEEESATSKGARYVGGAWDPPFACVIGEPSGWDGITLGYKGRILCQYRSELPEGHTAGPTGSAADALCQWWQGVVNYCRDYNGPRNRLFDQLLPTLRRIQTESDGLCDRATATGSLRLPPDVEVEALTEFLVTSAAPAAVTVSGFEPAFAVERQSPWVAAMSAAIRQNGGTPKHKLKTGTSDMNVVGPIWNCPIVAYGPGDSSLDHTPDEHIVLTEYHRAIQVLCSLIETQRAGGSV